MEGKTRYSRIMQNWLNIWGHSIGAMQGTPILKPTKGISDLTKCLRADEEREKEIDVHFKQSSQFYSELDNYL